MCIEIQNINIKMESTLALKICSLVIDIDIRSEELVLCLKDLTLLSSDNSTIIEMNDLVIKINSLDSFRNYNMDISIEKFLATIINSHVNIIEHILLKLRTVSLPSIDHLQKRFQKSSIDFNERLRNIESETENYSTGPILSTERDFFVTANEFISDDDVIKIDGIRENGWGHCHFKVDINLFCIIIDSSKSVPPKQECFCWKKIEFSFGNSGLDSTASVALNIGYFESTDILPINYSSPKEVVEFPNFDEVIGLLKSTLITNTSTVLNYTENKWLSLRTTCKTTQVRNNQYESINTSKYSFTTDFVVLPFQVSIGASALGTLVANLSVLTNSLNNYGRVPNLEVLKSNNLIKQKKYSFHFDQFNIDVPLVRIDVMSTSDEKIIECLSFEIIKLNCNYVYQPDTGLNNIPLYIESVKISGARKTAFDVSTINNWFDAKNIIIDYKSMNKSPDRVHYPNPDVCTFQLMNEWFNSRNIERNVNLDLSVIVSDISINPNQNDLSVLGTILGSYSVAAASYAQEFPTYKYEVKAANFQIYQVDSLVLFKKIEIDLKLVNISLNWVDEANQSNNVTYNLIKDFRFYITKTDVAELFSELQVYYEGYLNVTILRKGIFVELLKIEEPMDFMSFQSDKTKKKDFKKLLFCSKVIRDEIHWSLNSNIGFGNKSRFSLAEFSYLTFNINYSNLESILRTIEMYRKSYCIAYMLYKGSPYADNNSDTLNQNDYALHLPCNKSPSHVLSLTFNTIKIVMTYYDAEPVLTVFVKTVNINSVTFSSDLSQLLINLTSLSLYDETEKLAKHRRLIGNFDAITENRITITISNGGKENHSLIELDVKHLCIIYLHRAIFTVVCFLRDHFIQRVNEHFQDNNIPTSERNNCNKIQKKGFVRVTAVISKSEIHLPCSSSSADGITIIFDKLTIYKACPLVFEINKDYLLGPMLSNNIIVSDFDNTQTVLKYLFNLKDFDTSNPLDILWKLPHYKDEVFLVPEDVSQFTSCSRFQLNVSLTKTTICSWCNRNPIGENFDLSGTFTMTSADPEPDGMYHEVFKSLAFEEAKEYQHSTVTVDVFGEEINWILAQGQYLTIVNIIQQNACEIQKVVKDNYKFPIPKLIYLQENLYGSNCIDPRLPILSTVPIHLKKGKIVLVDNLPEYYDMISTNLTDNSQFGIESFEFTIPKYSYHHIYRKKVLNSLSSESRYATNEYENDTLNNERLFGNAILCMYFVKLEVDFYRIHFGGGNGNEVSAEEFVLARLDSSKNEYTSIDSFPDVNNISVESIILAPKAFSLLNKFRQDKNIPERDIDRSSNQPHIKYSQQGVSNLRRCVIEVTDTIAISHMERILATVGNLHSLN